MAARADDVGRDPADLVVTLMPMRRRHLRAVLRIEGQAEHRGWTLGLFMGELANERGRRYFCCWGIGHVISALHMP